MWARRVVGAEGEEEPGAHGLHQIVSSTYIKVGQRTMILVAAVRKIHPDHVKASLAEHVDRLDRVCLGSDGADDGCAAQVALRLERGIELGQPFDFAAEVEVVESSRHFVGLSLFCKDCCGV